MTTVNIKDGPLLNLTHVVGHDADGIGGRIGYSSFPLKQGIAVLGDSRLANSAAGTTYGTQGPTFINQASYRLKGRLPVIYDGAVSGQRSDQYLARLDAVLGSGAGMIAIFGVYNDVVQNYTAQQAWTGYNSAIGLKEAFDKVLAAGRRLFVITEFSGSALTAAQLLEVLRYNQLLRQYAAANHGVILFDATATMWDPSQLSTTIAFKSGYSSDGLHPVRLGGMNLGAALATLLDPIVPNFVPRPVAAWEYSSAAGSLGANHCPNGLFLDTSVAGTPGAGITGTVPKSWTVSRSGSATAVSSVVARSDGRGADLVLDCTFSAGGEYIQAVVYPVTTNYATGDEFEAWASVDVGANSGVLSAPTLRAYVQATAQAAVAANESSSYAGSPGLSAAHSLTLRTGRNVIGAGTISTAAFAVSLYAAAAGTVQVRLNNCGLFRRVP